MHVRHTPRQSHNLHVPRPHFPLSKRLELHFRLRGPDTVAPTAAEDKHDILVAGGYE